MGESGDDLMTPIDLSSDLELSDLHLTSSCHGDNERSKDEVLSSSNRETLSTESKQSSLSSLCLKAEKCNILINAKDLPIIEKHI